MAIRVRFDMTWTVNQMPDDPEHAGFLALAHITLMSFSSTYDPALRTQINPAGPGRIEIRMLWDINLDDAFGRFSEPQDYINYASDALEDCCLEHDPKLEIQVWRRADVAEALDHAEIAFHYGGDASVDDFPVFRPEPEADWEAADTVWMQDGVWFWSVSDEMKHLQDPMVSCGPCVGPDPAAIYTPWDDEYLLRVAAARKCLANISPIFA